MKALGTAPDSVLGMLTEPRSIAVIGASDNPSKLSGRAIDYLQRYGYAGRILPVNPRRQQVQGLRAYPDLKSVDGRIDLAILAVDSEATPDALRACAARGIGLVIAFAAGFAEAGERGAALQREVAQICRDSALRLIGPNCIGAIAASNAVTATFTSALDESLPLRHGPVALISQSGAFGTFIYSAAQAQGLDIGYFVNTGNEVDLSVAELLHVFAESPDVSVLLAYFEGVGDGPALVAAAERATELGKPILAVKTGRSAAGARAVSSHTASLAGEDAVFDAIVRQLGIIRVAGMEPLIDACRLLLAGRPARGRRLSIITASGGAAALMTDLAADAGILVEPWDSHWKSLMAESLPAHASATNPIDLTGSLISDPEILIRALEIAIRHPNTDLIAVMLGNADGVSERLVQTLQEAHKKSTVPLVVVWTGGSGRPRLRLNELGIPCYSDPGRAVVAMSALVQHGLQPSRPQRPAVPGIDADAARAVIDRVRAAGRTRLDEQESAELIAAYGINSAATRVAADADEAAEIVERFGVPVAVKALTWQVAHKSDLGAVRLGVKGRKAGYDAAIEVLHSAREAGVADSRVLIQQMANPGLELVLGIKYDAAFGAVVLVGMGGLLVEVLADSAIALPPLDDLAALRMLRSLRGQALLDGVRGSAGWDVMAAAEALVRVSLLADDFGEEIVELDINPLIVGPEGAGVTAVDGVVVLKDSARIADRCNGELAHGREDVGATAP